MKKALNLKNIRAQNIKRIPFTGAFYEAFGKPQNKGVWFIWGESGSGKSSFVLQLTKEFAKTQKVFYNLLEEETDDVNFIDRCDTMKMQDVEGNFLVQSYTLSELKEYLNKKTAPKVVVIDSLIYMTKKWDEYLALRKEYKDRIFIMVGHAKGKKPKTDFEVDVMYNAQMKVYVEGYEAISKGRAFGPNGGRYIIWKEGYERLKGKIQN